MNVLLDECVPARFAVRSSAILLRLFRERRFTSARGKEFDAFVTEDRKLARQQDLANLRIPVLLIRAQTNRLQHIQPLAADLLETIHTAPAGEVTMIGG